MQWATIRVFDCGTEKDGAAEVAGTFTQMFLEGGKDVESDQVHAARNRGVIAVAGISWILFHRAFCSVRVFATKKENRS